jgi:hypothetical protein
MIAGDIEMIEIMGKRSRPVDRSYSVFIAKMKGNVNNK